MGNLPLDLAVKSVYLQRYVSFFMYDFFFYMLDMCHSSYKSQLTGYRTRSMHVVSRLGREMGVTLVVGMHDVYTCLCV